MQRANGDTITYPRLRGAIAAGDLDLVRRYAREQGPLRLSKALEVCLVIRDRDPERYERAAARWISRFALEAHHASLEDLRQANSAFQHLPTRPAEAMEQLSALCVRHSVSLRG